MSVPQALLDIITVIKEYADLNPQTDNRVVVPLPPIWNRDEGGMLINKSVLEKALRRLEEMQLIKLIKTSDLRNHTLPLSSDKIIVEVNHDGIDRFLSQELAKQAQEETKIQPKPPEAEQIITTSSHTTDYPTEFKLQVVDREVWVNNYLIAKPHAVGNNYDFLEHVRKQPFNQPITKDSLVIDIQEAMGDKTFFKILNALGFKGEIKRAFFYKVDARTLCYRGDRLTLQQLKDAGVNIKLLVKELEAADAKYNPT